jgi:predicted TIM-barrel fold metal-dependent hydrolase
MKAYPGTFGGVALADPDDPGVSKTMRSLAKKGIRGFRVRATRERSAGWPESQGMNRMWEIGAEAGLFLCCLADPDGLPIIRNMCEAHPETPVAIDHCARIGMSGTIEPSDLDDLLRLAEFPAVHVKTSAFYALGKKEAPYDDLAPMIRQLRDAFGAERLMWGTDCPHQTQKGHTYADSIALIRDRLDFLSDTEKEWMLRGTAEKVFFG